MLEPIGLPYARRMTGRFQGRDIGSFIGRVVNDQQNIDGGFYTWTWHRYRTDVLE
ncbi:MAG TPA: hypothetical protein PKX52_07605 [Methanomassiliicoccaceae archaeon]|jgi:hypothetical protein|nr:hypothetical protein [Methanomassiliicoccaceae archaeon]HPT74751.1 hypothetical protein [Methanomassiliicoccaceae archaeon]